MQLRRDLLVLVTLGLVAGVLAPVAGAQSGQCATPNVSLRLAGGAFQPDETRNGALRIGNPNGFPAEAEVQVQAPAGWDAAVARSTVSVPAGNTTNLDITVVAPPEGSGVSQGEVQARVALTCMVGPFSDASGEPATSTATVQVADAGWPWVAVLLGGVALVGGTAGAVAVRNRRLAVELACHRPLLPVAPGGRASFPVAVANRRSEPDTVQLRVLDVPAGWQAFVAVPEVELGSREDRELWLMVRAPEDAEVGDQVTLTVEGVPVRGERGHRIAVGAHVVAEEEVAGEAEAPDEPDGAAPDG